jgi:hypothetical protein
MNVPLPLEGSTSRPDDFVVGAESNMRRPQNFLRASTSMSESLKFWVGGCISQEFARYIYLFFLLFSSSFERGARIRRGKSGKLDVEGCNLGGQVERGFHLAIRKEGNDGSKSQRRRRVD